MAKLYLVLLSVLIEGCAVLHHAQIGNIDNSKGFVKKPFDIKVSEIGVNLEEVKQIGKAAMAKNTGKQFEQVMDVIKLFQMGPSTGNPVFSKDYAKNLIQVVYEKCSSGRVTGLTSIRETNKYPAVSGEIVKITGFCLLPKEG